VISNLFARKAVIEALIADMFQSKACRIDLPKGMPWVEAPAVIPGDMRRFYEIAGGADFYPEAEFSFKILSPEEVLPANPKIVGSVIDDDISKWWYLIASDDAGEFVSIDLHPDRLGRCYDSFWDRHGVPGSCSIVALSFTQMLEGFWKARGAQPYWLADDFSKLGDAYDA